MPDRRSHAPDGRIHHRRHITKWLKKVAKPSSADEPLFEISTDKVDAEIPSPTAGILKEIKIAEGTTVEINTVVCSIEEGGTASHRPAPGQPQPRPPRRPHSTPHAPAAVDLPSANETPDNPSVNSRSRYRRADAPDGRVHHRGHHHQVAEEGWRHRPARRTHLRDLDG